MEVDSGVDDSVSSTPRATNNKLGVEDKSVVRLMCSFGGKILPRPHDNQLRYVGGDTRIVAVSRNTTYITLLSKLSKFVSNSVDFTAKYQLPNEDLDALITVSSDEDVENMMEEFERLTFQQNSNNNGSNNNNRVPRLRLFLFSNNSGIGEGGGDTPCSRTSSIASLLDGSRKRENWFLDALNGGSGGPSLERKMSEASSIVSEVPDYLFGLDNSDETSVKLKNRAGLGDGLPGSGPGSPAFGSASSASQFPNLPPVKTKLENPNPNPVEVVEPQPQPQQPSGFVGGQVWGPGSNPGSPYPVHNPGIPVYYVQTGPGQQGLVQQRNSHLQPVHVPVQVPVPVHGQFLPQFGHGPVQFPVGYPGSGPIYGPGEVQMQGNIGLVQGQGQGQVPSGLGSGQPVYYGVKNAGFPGMVVPGAGEEVVYGSSGSDPLKGRTMPMQP